MQLCLVQYTVIMFKRSTEIYTMNQICAPRNKAITLQNHGIADDEILNVYKFLNSTITALKSQANNPKIKRNDP